MPRQNPKAARRSLVALLFLASCWSGVTQAQQIPQPAAIDAGNNHVSDLQLEVTVNGRPSGFIAAFHKVAERHLTIDPAQLENCGIRAAPEAMLAGGLIDIGKLPGVSFLYDDKTQTISFTAMPSALATHRIDGGGRVKDAKLSPTSSPGALVNYTFYGSTGGEHFKDLWEFQGISGSFDMRIFGPLGLLTSSQIITQSPNELYTTARLDTTWSYSDPDRIVTYRAGDIITGGLAWTRPVRFGGVQIQRNFNLRSDLVTMPLPEVSGSAAVPSTVDLYVNNIRRSSQEVPAGPFSIKDIPAITGDANARLVVRDSLGRETVTETPLYASANLLGSGLLDYSAELGFARRNYAIQSFSYDERLIGIATGRYGFTDKLTFEGHAEASHDLINTGFGGVFAIGTLGIGTVAVAGSRYGNETGYLVSAGLEAEFWNLNWRVNSQRTFGDYNDAASVTSARLPAIRPSRAGPAKALDQINVSVPLSFDATTLNLSFTHVVSARDNTSRILGITANRAIGERGNAFVTAYADIGRTKTFGVFAGLTWTFADNITASTGITQDKDGMTIVSDLVKSERRLDGDLNWRLSDTEGSRTSRAATVAYRRSTGRVEGHVEQSARSLQARGQVDGSVVFAAGDVFLADRIDDAFGIVDAGSPNVDVEFENRPVGKTGRGGKLLVPNLRSYEANNLTIDPSSLPVDATIGSTHEIVTPHRGSGVVVNFAVNANLDAALVTLKTPQGEYVESGSLVVIDGSGATYVVGYDGQTYLTGHAGKMTLTVQQPTAGTCLAELDYSQAKGGRRTMPDAVCTRVE